MKLHLAIILVILMCSGCFSGNRSLFGTKTMGADIETARESTSAVIEAEVVQGNLKAIKEKAKEIEGRSQDEIVVVAAKDIQTKSKESAVLMKSVHHKLESIQHRSLGKTYWSKTKLLLLWIVTVIACGIGLRFAMPGVYTAVMRGIGEVISFFVGLVSGKVSSLRKDTLKHIDRSASINDRDLDPKTLADLDKLRRER